MRVRADHKYDKKVSQDGDQVCAQEQAEDGQLKFWIHCHCKKNELWVICIVYTFHIVDESYGKEIMNNLVRLVMMMILVMVHNSISSTTWDVLENTLLDSLIFVI